jgi:hypothetical protein
MPGHYARVQPCKPIDELFWRYVKKGSPDECWEWTGTFHKDGYGSFKAKGRKHSLASKVAYELTYGTVPPKSVVRHICHNPPCCNPRHLVVGTQKENMMDRLDLYKGKYHPSAFDPDIIRTMRALYQTGISQTEIGRMYGISHKQVHKIVHRQRYKHVK